jgi:ACS family hexuronate transporter-like MFS transporter
LTPVPGIGFPERLVKLRGLRWYIIGLLFLATVSNYLDRQTINVLSPLLIRELGMDKIEFSWIAAVFLGAYTIGMTFWGRLHDRIGLFAGLTICIAAWSLVASLHALAAGFASLLALRFLLGLAEAGNWPAAGKITAEWFPAHERAFALGIFANGSGIGAMVAPPIIVFVQQRYGWQATFLLTGLGGFLWLFAWLALYRPPARHPWVTPEELALIRQPATGPAVPAEAPPPRFRELLRHRQTWAVVVARFIADPIWWIYLVWLPQYLFEARGFDLKQISLSAWLPFLGADLGALAGGFAAAWLMRRRAFSVDRARKTCCVLGATFLPLGALVPFVGSASTAIGVMTLVLFAYQFWVNNVQAIPGDVFPSRAVGGVFGLGGSAAGLSSLLVMLGTGWTAQHFSFTPVFIAAALMGPLAATALLLLVGRIPQNPLTLPAARPPAAPA